MQNRQFIRELSVFLFNWNLRGFEAECAAWKMRAVRSILQVNCQGWQFSARRRRRGSPQEVDDRRGESSQTQDVSLCFINRPPQNSKNTVNNVDVNNFKKNPKQNPSNSDIQRERP